MNQKAFRNSTFAAVAAIGVGLFVGCGGSTGGGDGSGPVLGGGSSSGSISIDLVDSQLDVASTTGFTVSLTDANGSAASAGTRITCDTEDGVAIIEPSTGSESTDSRGQVSGRIGCEAPGSYRFVCRLPNAGSRSAAITVRCGGSAPNGFAGFPGAAGGGLGGGDGDGVTDFDSNRLRITSVVFEDLGEATATVDTIQNANCNSNVPATPTPSPTPPATAPTAVAIVPEPFTDAFVKFTVENQSGQTVNISSFRYTVPNFNGSSFTSSIVAVSGNNGLTIASDGSAELRGFFAIAGSGVKQFIGSDDAIGGLGFRNVTLTVSGVTDAGEEFELTAISGVSLQNYNNCP